MQASGYSAGKYLYNEQIREVRIYKLHTSPLGTRLRPFTNVYLRTFSVFLGGTVIEQYYSPDEYLIMKLKGEII